jgi:hypothetical protein
MSQLVTRQVLNTLSKGFEITDGRVMETFRGMEVKGESKGPSFTLTVTFRQS